MKLFLRILLIGAFYTNCLAQNNEKKNELSLAEEIQTGIKKMKQGKWSKALKHFDIFTDTIENREGNIFDETYGAIYYNKGSCYLKLASREDDEFEKNELYKQSIDSYQKARENQKVHSLLKIKCLYYQAQAEQGRGNYALAIKLNKQFMREIEELE